MKYELKKLLKSSSLTSVCGAGVEQRVGVAHKLQLAIQAGEEATG